MSANDFSDRFERPRHQLCFRRLGFTLIELLVVVAIIALLISILLPSLSTAKNRARDTVDRSNLNQIGKAIVFYTTDNAGHLPAIRDKDGNLNSQYNNGPYHQYDIIYNMWEYYKDLRIFVCPRAEGSNSVLKHYPNGKWDGKGSQYVANINDDYYTKRAYAQQWWPNIKPQDFTSNGGFLTPVYTEYYTNDYSSADPNNPFICDGKPMSGINGSRMDRIPLPQFAVPVCDAVWNSPNTRHNGANHFLFLDGHVSAIKYPKYWDNSPATAGRPKQDEDPYGNRCFYCWGMCRAGWDGGPTDNEAPDPD